MRLLKTAHVVTRYVNQEVNICEAWTEELDGTKIVGIVLRDPESGDRVMTATSVLVGHTEKICVKDYSENEGILGELLRLNVVELTGEVIESGFCIYPVVKIVETRLH